MQRSTMDVHNSEDAAVSRFFAKYPKREFAAGELLVFGDSTIPDIFYIVSGAVTQQAISDSGSRTILNSFGPGAFFPIQWALTDTPNEYFYEAVGDVVARVAPYRDALAFLADNPPVTMDLLQRVLRGAAGIQQKLELLMTGSASGRLWHELLVCAERFGRRQEDKSVHLHITETQLSQQTGLARETVSRELQKLKKAGLIKRSRGEIRLSLTP